MRKICNLLYILLLFFVVSCIHKYPHEEDESGMHVEWQSVHPEELTDIRLWVFDSNELLKETYVFATLDDARSVCLAIPSEQMTLVAATCPSSSYSVTAKTGETTLAALLVALNDASSNPPHIQSGMTKVNAGTSEACITLVRVLSELRFTIKNVPPEVVKIEVKVLNCARGFYPGTNKLGNAVTVVTLGELSPVDGQVIFPLCRLMPVIPEAENSGVTGNDTRITVTMTYADGVTSLFRVEAPTLENNGVYEVISEYEWYRKGITLRLDEINGWRNSNTVEGGTLVPEN